MAPRGFTFDASLIFKATGAVAASAAAPLIIDTLNGATLNTGVEVPRYDGVIFIDVSALDIATGDEEYDIIIQGSNSSTFANTVANLGASIISVDTIAGSSADDTIGRYELPFSNEKNEARYRYLRLYTLLRAAGSTITYKAVGAIQANGL